MGEVATYVATRLAQIVSAVTPPPTPVQPHTPVIDAVRKIIESKPRTPPHIGTKSKHYEPEDTKPSSTGKKPNEVVNEAKPKDVPKKAIKKKIIKKAKPRESIFTSVQNLDGVHIDLYSYFDLSPSIANASEIDKMRDIHTWAFGKQTDAHKALKKLTELETKIGRSAIGSNKLNQLWNWIKIRELT